LVGDNTESVVRWAPQPVFVVKKKGETGRFLEALLYG